jgi:hypothetical protein
MEDSAVKPLMFTSVATSARSEVAALPEMSIAHVPVAFVPETEGAPTSV